MSQPIDVLSREERAALRRLRELLKEQQRARREAPVQPQPTPKPGKNQRT